MKKRIAIVGGGTSALYLLKAFVDENNPEVTLAIFEASDRLGDLPMPDVRGSVPLGLRSL